jgi:hypothetical protein
MAKEKLMTKLIKGILVMALFLIPVIALGAGEKKVSFSPYVDGKGGISLPPDFRAKWVHLGTWFVTSQTALGPGLGKTAPGSGLNEVYTQPESLRAYKKNAKWPDGTVLVMEIRTMKWDDLPTGHVIYADEPVDWFVMIKDGKGRFKNNPNWGDGWGWALFKAADPKKNISTGYKNDCLGCHEVAKDTDWAFVHGYPTLR